MSILRNISKSYYGMDIISNLDSNLNTIKKDLEILEIFKKHITNEEYNKLKEWLLK